MIENPLTAVDNRKLNTELARLEEMRTWLVKGKNAGLDVDDAIATLDILKAQIEAVKREFLPQLP